MSSDIGIKVSQQGYDVETCADKDLLFSSSWPSLDILYQGTVECSTAGQVLYEHNLDYPPAFMVFDDVLANNSINYTKCYMTDHGLYYANDTPSSTMKYMIFNWNLLTNYDSPVTSNVSSLGEINFDWGVKVSKAGQDILTAPLKNQVINSGGRTPMIHKAGYGESDPGVDAVINHNLGYVPMFLDYVQEPSYPGGVKTYSGKWYLRRSYDMIAPSEGISAIDNITSTQLTIPSYLPGIKYAYIIFKDPAT